MRRLTRFLLLVFAFAIPWEYSLDWGPPVGNIARIAGLALLLVAIPTVLHAGRTRPPGALQWLALALLLWACCSCFWSVDPAETTTRVRGYAQEMLPVWLVWEFAESTEDLRWLLRAAVTGSWMLAVLTIVDMAMLESAADQIRFSATGQDPNDVARFLDLGFPLAALLIAAERRRTWRALAWGYLPVGLAGVLLT
ncbi:MAG: hypothetical protein WCE75_12375, partial [Terracidiphilus sp.]